MRESEVRSVDEASDEMSHCWKQEGHPQEWPLAGAHGPSGCLDSPKAVKFVYELDSDEKGVIGVR